jgi:hypothetical protein
MGKKSLQICIKSTGIIAIQRKQRLTTIITEMFESSTEKIKVKISDKKVNMERNYVELPNYKMFNLVCNAFKLRRCHVLLEKQKVVDIIILSPFQSQISSYKSI